MKILTRTARGSLVRRVQSEDDRVTQSQKPPIKSTRIEEKSVEVGERVEMTIRRLYTQEGVPRSPARG